MSESSYSKLFPDLYIDTSEGELKLLNTDAVRLKLQNEYGIISSRDSTVEDIHPNIVKVRYELNGETIEDVRVPIKYRMSPVYLDSKNNPVITVNYVKDDEQVRFIRTSNRQKRLALLADTDWIETSTAVTETTKVKYKAYRQLLRDIFVVESDENYINFPTAPKIEMKALNSYRLSDKELDKLQKHIDTHPKVSKIFLDEWSNLKFTRVKSIINNLLELYTDFDLDIILS